jgi:hypothetical protein
MTAPASPDNHLDNRAHGALVRRALWVACALALLSGALALRWGIGRSPTKTGNHPATPIKSRPASTPVAAPPVALAFALEQGDVLAYRFDVRSRSDLDVGQLLRAAGVGAQSPSGSGQRQKLDVVSGGTLNLKVFDADAAHWNVAARLSELSYSIGDQSSPEIGGMRQPFSFRLARSGAIDELRFMPGVSPKARDAVRQVLSWFQVVLPKQPQSSWSAEESDATGTFAAAYTIDAVNAGVARLSKRKVVYTSITNSLTPKAGDTQVEVLESKIGYELPARGAWITKGSMLEKLALSARRKRFGTVESLGTLRRLETPPAVVFPATFAEYTAAVSSATYLAQKQYETNPTLDALWGHLSTREALSAFLEMFAKDQNAAEALMINYLRQHPARSAELVQLLDAATKGRVELDQTARLTLWRLNATAGHKEAQRAQLDAALSRGSSRTTRMNALAHLEFANPEQFVVDDLLGLRRSALKSSDPAERELADMALLSLGALGATSQPNPAMTESINQSLTSYLTKSERPADAITALQALGNAGNPQAIDAITPYLSSPDRGVQLNALAAFRRMDDPRAFEILRQQFEAASDPLVRHAALAALAAMPANTQSMTWAASVAGAPSLDVGSQALLAQWLGSKLSSHPANEAVLRRMLAQSTAFEVRKTILKYISP